MGKNYYYQELQIYDLLANLNQIQNTYYMDRLFLIA